MGKYTLLVVRKLILVKANRKADEKMSWAKLHKENV